MSCISARLTLVGLSLASLLTAPALGLALQEGVVGQDTSLRVKYSSIVQHGGDVVIVAIQLVDKQVLARINYKKQSVNIRAQGLADGSLARMTEQDLAALNALKATLHPGPSRVDDALVSTLEFVSAYPANEFIMINAKPQPTQAWISLCDQIDQLVTGSYTVSGQVITETEVCGSCGPGPGDCLGRCGPGCGSPPSPSTQRFTQECFNHDLCTRATGQSRGPCLDELLAAVRGFFLAPDCANVTGSWSDNFGYAWALNESRRGAISGSVDVTSPSCGTWDVTGSRSGFAVTLTATNPPPIEPDCCTAFTYSGEIRCNAGSGTWTNQCGLDGTWSMSRQGIFPEAAIGQGTRPADRR